jgi:parallel beta-helix repeat protein
LRLHLGFALIFPREVTPMSWNRIVVFSLVVSSLFIVSTPADPGTAFTYQGRLADGTTAIENPVDLRFSLWDASSDGGQVGTDLEFTNTSYDGGIVQLELDFGAGSFDGDPRWLEIELANPTGSTYVILSGRIEILPAPYAIMAADVIGGVAAKRIAIESLPFTINAAGSYYVAAALTGTLNTDGITINASNVTIDLNGFTLSGAAGSTSGNAIVAGTPVSRITIQNGTIEGWAGNGINATDITQCLCTHLVVSGNTGTGVVLGSSNQLLDSNIISNGAGGVQATSNCVIKDSNISENTGDGINVSGTNNVVRDNQLINNTGDGIELTAASAENTVRENECVDNTSAGIRIDGLDSFIEDNQLIDNGNGFNAGASSSNNRIANNYGIGSGGNNFVMGSVFNDYEVLITEIPVTIDVPCMARMVGNLVNSTNNGDGILIESSNVTLDLGGFTLFGTNGGGTSQYGNGVNEAGGDTDHGTVSGDPLLDLFDVTSPNSDLGIRILGQRNNLHIKNGSVIGWGEGGISVSTADNSLYENLTVAYNDGDGMFVDKNCIIRNCRSAYNSGIGFFADDGSTFNNCVAQENGSNGFQTVNACVFINCTAHDNQRDGFGVGAGSSIESCSALDNAHHGFDLASGSVITNSVAYNNGTASDMPNGTFFAGFDVGSAKAINCIAALNDGPGFLVSINSAVQYCTSYENDGNGIRVTGSDSLIADNHVLDNDWSGIRVDTSGCLIVRNHATGNFSPTAESTQGGFPAGTLDDNYAFDRTGGAVITLHGPIVDLTTLPLGGDISAAPGSTHPQANFVY